MTDINEELQKVIEKNFNDIIAELSKLDEWFSNTYQDPTYSMRIEVNNNTIKEQLEIKLRVFFDTYLIHSDLTITRDQFLDIFAFNKLLKELFPTYQEKIQTKISGVLKEQGKL